MSVRKSNKKDKEPITYVCDNCGANVSAINEVPRCVGCGKALCEICNNYLLCPQDYHKLEKKDQKKIKRYGTALANAHSGKVVFTVMPAIMGSIAIVLLILMIVLRRDIFYFLFGFLGGFLLLSALMMFFMFYNIEEREKKRITQQVRDLLRPYNIQRVVQEPGKRLENIKKDEKDEAEKIQSIFCPSCGTELRGVNLKYCEMCGYELSKKSGN